MLVQVFYSLKGWTRLGKKYIHVHVSVDKETVVSSFRKCGLCLAIDGLEDGEINIQYVIDE